MCVKSLFTRIIAILFALNVSQSTFAENLTAEAYRDRRDRLHAIERRPNALETVAQAQDAEVLREALEDLLKFSHTTEENQVAMENIETALAKIPETDLEYQKVTLFKGKVLRRLGRMEDGDAIFVRAFEEQWGQAHYDISFEGLYNFSIRYIINIIPEKNIHISPKVIILREDNRKASLQISASQPFVIRDISADLLKEKFLFTENIINSQKQEIEIELVEYANPQSRYYGRIVVQIETEGKVYKAPIRYIMLR